MFRLLFVVAILILSACGENRPAIQEAQEIENLLPPADIIVTENSSSVTLSWASEVGVKYKIYWTTDSTLPLAQWSIVSVSTGPYTHTNLQNNTTYYYRISVDVDGKESEPSAMVSAKPSTASMQAPTNVKVKVGDNNITLTWNAVAGVQQYKIYWTTDENQDPKLSNSLPRQTTETSLLFGDLSNGVTYYFVVVSQSGTTESSPSEKVWGTPQLTRPQSPANLEIATVGSNFVTIQWEPVPGAQSYRVYWSKGNPDFDLNTAGKDDIDSSVTQYTLTQMDEGLTYYMRVAAINENGEGDASIALEIVIDLPISTDPTIEIPGPLNISVQGVIADVNWTAKDLTNTYRLFYATEPGVTPENYMTLENGNSTSELRFPRSSINNLIIARRYYLVAVAYSGNNRSLPSDEISFLVEIPPSSLDRADLQYGARLYARWYQPINTPKTFHPLWQEAAKDSQGAVISQANEADSWRCAECHGWDYRGKDGEYGYGSKRYTGFPGVSDAAINLTPEKILNFILGGKTASGADHSFVNNNHDDAMALTRFILEATNVGDFWAGNENNGQQLFNNESQGIPACATSGCHTQFSDVTDLEILPFSLENTARAVHSIQYGIKIMPGERSLQDARDVLRFLWMQQINLLTDNFDQALYDQTGTALNDQIAQGGVLYDRWWLAKSEEKFVTPASNHPLWPAGVTSINGSYTWRCQACHGWDYRGNQGVNKAGPYFTGITGILQSNGLSDTPADLYNFLRLNELHAYSAFLNDNDMYALTRFIMTMREQASGSLAPHNLLNEDKEEPNIADKAAGRAHYFDLTSAGGCDACHLKDGNNWFFNDLAPERNEIQSVATISKESPWEFLHKIRFGQPGANMLGLIQYGIEDPGFAVDVLAFSQTDLDPDLKRGARLYDNWWEENKLAEPSGQHALWPAAGSELSTVDTWRCVNCHGWDYTGTEGFNGLLNPIQDVESYIASGTVINPNDHAFLPYLKQQDITDLVTFINDPSEGVRADIGSLIPNANSSAGQQIYQGDTPGNCVNCHGQQGTSIPSVDLKTLAGNFAERFVHVARFGSPSSAMLPGLSRYTGLTAEQAADVQSYALSFDSTINTSSSIDRGARLFDNWFVEMKVSEPNTLDPVVKNPLWENRNSSIEDVQSLSDSWRCVSCHNWSYKGKDFVTTAPDADNLLKKLEQRSTLYPTDEALTEYLVTWITNGTGSQHNYGTAQSGLPTILGEREINDLVSFLMEGIIDSSLYIYNLDGSAVDADLVRGKALYEGTAFPELNCANCHGDNGDAIPPGSSQAIDIFALARTNAWQYFHKVRFAAPGTDMPALYGVPGTTAKDAADLLGYAQSQFDQRSR